MFGQVQELLKDVGNGRDKIMYDIYSTTNGNLTRWASIKTEEELYEVASYLYKNLTDTSDFIIVHGYKKYNFNKVCEYNGITRERWCDKV